VKKALRILLYVFIAWECIHFILIITFKSLLKLLLLEMAAGCLLLLIVAIIIFIRGCRKKPQATVAKPSAHYDESYETNQMYEQTARINLALRLDPYVTQETLNVFESLIDKLHSLVKIMPSRSSEAAYDIMQLGKSHLPALADRFLALPAEGRKKAEGELIKQLQDLLDAAKKAETAFLEGRFSDFEAQQEFLKIKFGSSPSASH
jgi:hypothetical protein